jgi:tetratricopeptide (TPR) repeat protein/ABC-type transport system involved in cytochrome c biogenesis ATPase subunit
LGTIFDLSPLSGQDLKGIAGPVDAYLVEGDASVQSRFAARQSGAMTPIVGREREIELMSERWALARSDQGQMVIVSGEAGIGKSRITQAVIDVIANDDHTRMTYQCSPYHADSAFYPITQQMSFAAGFAPSDSPDMRLDKLETLLGSDHDTLRLVAPLLGLDGAARYGALDLTPAQQRAQTMKALTGLLVRQAAEKPVLMVFEDLHWVDPTSEELLDLLLDQITDQPIMILATARPTFEYGFGGHPIVTRFALNRLGKDQIGAIVSKLTGGKALPDEIMELIVQRTDGVPLFVEELTKTILESGALKESEERYVLDGPLSAIAIPATLHDSLMARLDRLQPIKEVAQTAACIGREFSHGLLSQISPLSDAELSMAMEGLITAELIYRRGVPPEATYLFKHALVRDAAYESLLKKRRSAVHTRILTALETDTDVAPEILAVHAEAANMTDRAIDLWQNASKSATARPAFDEAISHLGRAIALITPALENSDTPPFERALALQVQLSMALFLRKGYRADETLLAFEQALSLADLIGETPMRYPILYGLWVSTGVRGQNTEALRAAEALVDLAGKSQDTAALVVANRVACTSNLLTGDIVSASRFIDTALTQFDPIAHANLANRFGQDVGVTVHLFKFCTEILLGRTKDALKHADEAERIARATGHFQTICYFLAIRALGTLIMDNQADFERCADELFILTHEHDLEYFLALSVATLEIAHAQKGDQVSVTRYISADAKIVSMKCKWFLPKFRIKAGWAALKMGLEDEAMELATMAQTLMKETGEVYVLADAHRLFAAIAKARDDRETAEKHLVRALDVARQQGAKFWELRAAIDLADLWRDQGKATEAISLLKPIHASIADCDCPADKAAARELLATLAG